MAKGKSKGTGSKTFLIGRDAKTGRLIPVAEARNRPSRAVVERMPKAGYGDTKPRDRNS